MTPGQRDAALARADRLLWAALGIQVDANGLASKRQNWRPIKTSP